MPEDRTLSFDFTPKPPPKPADGGEGVRQVATAPAPVPAAAPVAGAVPSAAPVPGKASAAAPAPPAVPKPAEAEGPRALTVAEFDRALKDALEGTFKVPAWVEGEITGARPAPSGHLYFCLKDEREEASIDVVAYRSNVTPRMRALCVDGARVRVRGLPTLWAPRGRLQLIADRLQLTGRGALLEAIEKLKAKLAAEGLFAPERKRRLPSEPRIIGVVTSAGGAVIHDVCRVAFRRGGARILLSAATVQGPGAVESICRALGLLQRVRDLDVIIVGRGGGSADDLGAFNDESVVRAVAASRVPIVSAVGHDVDITLVDFVADARAATPSQAAELTVPDRRAQRELLRRTRLHLARAMHGHLAHDRVAHVRLARRLGDPRLAIAAHQQTLDDRVARLASALRAGIVRRRHALTQGQRRLAYLHPRAVIARERTEVARLGHRLSTLWGATLARRGAELQRTSARLDALSPLKVLGRGYAIATRGDGRAIRGADDVSPGQTIHVRVDGGRLDATVVRVEPATPRPVPDEPR